MEYSKYQTAIFDWVQGGKGNAVVNAVAGSGKTTTLVEVAKRLNDQSAIFLAFNKHIADELGNRLDGVECRTIHSLGFRAVAEHSENRIKVNGYKYHDAMDEVMMKIYGSKPPRRPETAREEELAEIKKQALDVLDRARLWLVDFRNHTALDGMCAHFGLVTDNGEYELAQKAMKVGWRMFQEEGKIDYTDMIYYPVVMKWSVPQYDFVLVDEAQDLSPVQLEMALKARDPHGGRVLAVGDRRQAIQGFAGADSNSINKIVDRLNAVELPLSICYRCPVSHVRMAQEIVPHIEAAGWAEEGVITRTDEDRFSGMVEHGDLIVCRTTAPLIGYAFKLIAMGIPARVRGRDVAKSLVATLEKISKPMNFEFDNFMEELVNWSNDQIRKLSKKRHSDMAIERVHDMVACLEAAYMGSGASSVDDLISHIEGIFADDKASVWLSTVHRAKGLEADRVFILHPEKMPLVWRDQLDWEYEQEMNIKYVALTRSKRDLYFVDSTR